MLRSFSLPTALLTNTSPSSSTSIQTGAACAVPSSFSVTRCAKFFAFSSAISRSVRSATSTLLLLGHGQPQTQVAELFVRDGRGSSGQRIESRLRLGERDHLCDGVLPREQHHHAIPTERDP